MNYTNLKRSLFYQLVFLFIANPAISQVVTTSKVADKIADAICKKAILDRIGKNKKIAVCLFLQEDTIKTKLGIKISQCIAQNLTYRLNNKDYEILFPDDVDNKFLSSAMGKFFETPKTSDEETEFWQKYLNNKKPDYWLTGKYLISNDNNSIIITNLYLKAYIYDVNNSGKKSVAVNDDYIDININKEDKNNILELNKPITNFSDYYFKLIDLEGKANIFSFEIINDKLKSEVEISAPLKIGSDYQIKINLKESAFVYCFYFDPKENDHAFFDMIYPLDKDKIKPLSAGVHYLPENTVFTVEPPPSDVYIKILVSKKLIPIEFAQFLGKNGLTYTYFKYDDCKAFLEKICRLPQIDYQTNYIIKKVTK
jgi:hypothetical protein